MLSPCCIGKTWAVAAKISAHRSIDHMYPSARPYPSKATCPYPEGFRAERQGLSSMPSNGGLVRRLADSRANTCTRFNRRSRPGLAQPSTLTSDLKDWQKKATV